MTDSPMDWLNLNKPAQRRSAPQDQSRRHGYRSRMCALKYPPLDSAANKASCSSTTTSSYWYREPSRNSTSRTRRLGSYPTDVMPDDLIGVRSIARICAWPAQPGKDIRSLPKTDGVDYEQVRFGLFVCLSRGPPVRSNR